MSPSEPIKRTAEKAQVDSPAGEAEIGTYRIFPYCWLVAVMCISTEVIPSLESGHQRFSPLQYSNLVLFLAPLPRSLVTERPSGEVNDAWAAIYTATRH